MFNKGYSPQKDSETPLLSQNNSIHDISDNRVRYVTMGIVNMIEPLKGVQPANRSFVVYDSFEQNMISFDINTIYEKYIKNGIDHIETSFGKYKLTQKTIDDISRLVRKSYECH